ncbi:MAG: hypothetical protein ABJL72_16335 [Roseobacter sp.]
MRRSINWHTLAPQAYRHGNFRWGDVTTNPFERDLASYFPEVRKWAVLEIAKITGKIETDGFLTEARKADKAHRQRAGEQIGNLTPGHCDELVLG